MRHLLPGAVEACYGRAVMVAAEPLVVCSEFTFAEFWFFFNGMNCLLQCVNLDTVYKIAWFLHWHAHHTAPRSRVTEKISLSVFIDTDKA